MARADAVHCSLLAMPRFIMISDQPGGAWTSGRRGFCVDVLDMESGERVWRHEVSVMPSAF